MIKAKCTKCNFKLNKHRWEHMIYAIYKLGANAGKEICPKCKKEGLKIDFGER